MSYNALLSLRIRFIREARYTSISFAERARFRRGGDAAEIFVDEKIKSEPEDRFEIVKGIVKPGVAWLRLRVILNIVRSYIAVDLAPDVPDRRSRLLCPW